MFVGYEMAVLTSAYEPALTLLFTELNITAAGQEEAFLGSPGTLSERTNNDGTAFWVHRFSDGAGRRREVYLGKVDDADVSRNVSALRERIEAANITISRVRILARAGFSTLDRKSYATLASLANHGLFRAGALLIGSHAYGSLLNVIGVRAVPYATEDIDIARREALVLPGVPAFLEMLRETGIEFFAVPQLKRGAPATSFRERSGSRMHVDLLVPSSGEDYPIIPVPELQTHATGLPYLAYLLAPSQEVPLLSPYGVVQVRVPVPERYAVHKLIVSQLRSAVSDKVQKDLRQAATLIDALSERFPGAVEEALSATPRSAKRHLRRALDGLRAHLPQSAEAAWETLATLSKS
jgi:hypothetical protein